MQKGLKPALLIAAIIGLHGCGDTAAPPPSSTAAAAHAVEGQATALKPRQFATVQAMIEDRADFDEGNGTFKLISGEPLHIQMAAEVVANDLPEVVLAEVQRAALYGVYRSLIHTDAQSVRVTAVPMEYTVNPYTSRYLEAPTVDVTVTREQALQAAKQVVDAATLADLVVPDASLGIQLDKWAKPFEPYYYQTEGQQQLLKALQAQ